MADVLVVAIVMFTILAVVGIAKMKEYAVESSKLRMEEKLKTDEYNQRLLSLDDSSGTTVREIQALREEIQNLSRQVAEIKEQIQLCGTTDIRQG